MEENIISFDENTINFEENTINFEENTINFKENTLQLPNICKSTSVLLRRTLTTIQNRQVYLCSTQENTLQLPNICKSVCVLTQENTLQLSNICESTCVILRRTLYNYPKLTCLHVFYSGEHFTTTQYLHVYLCSTTQENTSQLPNICKSVCVQDFTFQV